MGLKEKVGLDVGVSEALLGELEWHSTGELAQNDVLSMSDGQGLVLSSVGDYLHQTAQLGLLIQGHAEQLCREGRGGGAERSGHLYNGSRLGLAVGGAHCPGLTDSCVIDVIV